MTRWIWLALGLVLASAQLGCGNESNDRDADGVPDSEDCDDFSSRRWREVSVYPDTDEDGVGASTPSTLCIGEQPPRAYSLEGGDCAPQDAGRWRTVDGLFRDADGDGVASGSGGSGSTCIPTWTWTARAADPRVRPAVRRYGAPARVQHRGQGK
jgi:hypothetical protein